MGGESSPMTVSFNLRWQCPLGEKEEAGGVGGGRLHMNARHIVSHRMQRQQKINYWRLTARE